MMTYFRLGTLAAAISLSSCGTSTVPEPPEFRLSAEALSQQYPATRKSGAVRLYAQEIQTTHDELGRETYLGSGGALLVKNSVPPIQALAPSISVTPDFSEVRGQSTVKKQDLLYIGKKDATTIRIEGDEIKPEGSHVIRGIAAEEEAAPRAKTAAPESVSTQTALTPTFHRKPPPAPILVEQPVEPREPVETKPISKPKVKRPPPAAKPQSKPKETPAADRSRLLNLMREPTDR